MENKSHSSPRKRSTKANTPSPSTTSSTTAKPARKKRSPKKKVATKKITPPAEANAAAIEPISPQRANILLPLTDQSFLDTDQQQAYLSLLSKGASPAAACQQMAITLPLVAATIEGVPAFRSLLDRVNELLSQNVAAALYRSAMEGSVSAQTFFLKNKPPPEWPDQSSPDPSAYDDNLSDDELIAHILSGAALLTQFTKTTAADMGKEVS